MTKPRKPLERRRVCGISALLRYYTVDLPQHARRHRRRFREHTRPFLHRRLCLCTTPTWEPGIKVARYAAKTWWMWAHALELLRALGAHAPRMVAPARYVRGERPEYCDLQAQGTVHEPRIVIELRRGALGAPSTREALERAGYRVERTREDGARVLEAERDFLVCVRERPEGVGDDVPRGFSHRELVESFEAPMRRAWFRYAPREWLELDDDDSDVDDGDD